MQNAMAPDRTMQDAYPEHAFLLLQHPLCEAVIAIPLKQATEEKAAAVQLWHGASVRISQAAGLNRKYE